MYRQHRPTKFKDVIGQDEAVKVLTNWLNKHKMPHAIRFTGPSGCGKTTIARILGVKLGAGKHDYKEINCAGKGGIDMVRAIQDNIDSYPMFGKVKVYVLDEAHELTRAGQEGLLKVLEDCPKHAYVFLCTTQPEDLIKTILTRATEIRINPLSHADLCKTIASVVVKTKNSTEYPPDEVIERIAEVADGSARTAINILGKVIDLETVDEQLNVIQKSETKKVAIDLARILITPKPQWKEVKEVIKSIEEEAETVRRIVLNYIAAVCLGGGRLSRRAATVYEVFRDYFATGRPDLVFACFAACKGD